MDAHAAPHDHSAHASTTGGMEHDKYHGAVQRHADGSYFYTHGAFLGHVVPGSFFIVWGTWWAVCLYHYYLRACVARKQFTGRAWWRVPFGSARVRNIPFEPLVMVLLPLCGILGELWLGHESYRKLFADNGMFFMDNLNDWQHSTMYAAFMTAGLVDLAAHYLGAPALVEKAYLLLAFLVQGTLLVFHLKGPDVEIMVHLILALQVFATVFAIMGEIASPHSIIVASLRPAITILQGVWWIQTAYIMYRGVPMWDPDYMGSVMMVPVVFVLHMLWISAAMLALLLVMRALHARYEGRPIAFVPPAGDARAGHAGASKHEHDEHGIELGSLIPDKSYLA